VTAPRHGRRWKLALPLAAVGVAAVLIALAALTRHAMVARNELALDGRLLGLAHSAETWLREEGVDDPSPALAELLADGAPEVTGLSLVDASGSTVAAVGTPEAGSRVRTVDLYLGRHGGGRPRPTVGDPTGPRPGGRGRFELRMQLHPAAGALPLAARALLPTVVAAGVALVVLAWLAGRFLDRQGRELELAAERRRIEGLARAGAGLAHQLRTPLATIKGTGQLMSESAGDALRSRVDTIVAEADRMNRLLGRLLDYARPPAPEPQLVDVSDIVRVVAERHPAIDNDLPDDAVAWVDPEHLEEILDNLLANAAFFNPEGSTAAVGATVGDGELRLTVRDHGPGPGDDPEVHFEPYRTTRADGTGLGLPIARALAEANRGSLRLERAAGGGCVAVLALPVPPERS